MLNAMSVTTTAQTTADLFFTRTHTHTHTSTTTHLLIRHWRYNPLPDESNNTKNDHNERENRCTNSTSRVDLLLRHCIRGLQSINAFTHTHTHTHTHTNTHTTTRTHSVRVHHDQSDIQHSKYTYYMSSSRCHRYPDEHTP
jgi:hypothetical protein